MSEKRTLSSIAIEHIPFLYAMLVLFGYLNLEGYYRHFGIDIWPYLSVSELLLSVLRISSDAIYVLAAFSLLVMIAVGLVQKLEGGWKSDPFYSKNGLWKNIGETPSSIIWSFFMLAGSLTSQIRGTNTFAILCICIPVSLGLFVWLSRYPVFREHIYLYFMVLLGCFLALLSLYRFEEAVAVYKGRSHSTARAFLETGEMIGDERTVFLGRTNSTFFFFDRDQQHAYAIPSDQVIRFYSNRLDSTDFEVMNRYGAGNEDQ